MSIQLGHQISMFRGALGELYSGELRGPEISFITWGGDVVQYTAEGGRDFLALFSPMSCQDAGVLCPIFFSFLLVSRRRPGEEFSGRLCMASWFEAKELQSSKERKFSFCCGRSVR